MGRTALNYHELSHSEKDLMADLDAISRRDIDTLVEKGRSYGDSWKRRGGVGAFMMLARKWDRIENIARQNSYDVLKAGEANVGDIMDDIADLRRYLMLVEREVNMLASDPMTVGHFRQLRLDEFDREQENMRAHAEKLAGAAEHSESVSPEALEEYDHIVMEGSKVSVQKSRRPFGGLLCPNCELNVETSPDPWIHVVCIEEYGSCYRCNRATLSDEHRGRLRTLAGERMSMYEHGRSLNGDR